MLRVFPDPLKPEGEGRHVVDPARGEDVDDRERPSQGEGEDRLRDGVARGRADEAIDRQRERLAVIGARRDLPSDDAGPAEEELGPRSWRRRQELGDELFSRCRRVGCCGAGDVVIDWGVRKSRGDELRCGCRSMMTGCEVVWGLIWKRVVSVVLDASLVNERSQKKEHASYRRLPSLNRPECVVLGSRVA